MKTRYLFLLVLSIVLVLPSISAATNISICQGTVTTGDYELNQSINRTTAANCLVFENNVSLNCKGFSITMSTASGYAAIHAQNKNNTVIKNCIILNASSGIQLDKGFNATIINNTFDNRLSTNSGQTAITQYGGYSLIENNTFLGGKYHIYATAYSGVVSYPEFTIINNVMNNATIVNIFNDAAGTVRVSNTILKNNTITGGNVNQAALYFANIGANNITLKDNYFFINNTGTASQVWFRNATNILIENNQWGNATFRGYSSATVYSLFAQGGENITFINNRFYTNTVGGAVASASATGGLNSVRNILIKNNSFDATGVFNWGFGCGGDTSGITSSSNNCTMIDNTVYSLNRTDSALHGYVIVWMQNVSAINNFVNGTYQGAVIKGIVGSCDIRDNRLYNNIYKGLFDKQSTNCIFQNNTIAYGTTYDIFIGNDGTDSLPAINSTWINNIFLTDTAQYKVGMDLNSTATIINMTYPISNETVCTFCNLTRKWWFSALVLNTNDNAISDARVALLSLTSKFDGVYLTGSDGRTQLADVVDYVNNGGTRTYYQNYDIGVTKSGYHSEYFTNNFTSSESLYNYIVRLEYSSCDGNAQIGYNLILIFSALAMLVYGVYSVQQNGWEGITTGQLIVMFLAIIFMIVMFSATNSIVTEACY